MHTRVARSRRWSVLAATMIAALGTGCSSADATLSPSVGGEGGDAGVDSGQNICGNGVVEDLEECDDGNPDVGDGCENDCRFSCIAGDPARDACDDGNDCNGKEACSPYHRCIPSAPLAEGDECGVALVCVHGNCVPASCGDGQLEDPEECDDGNAADGDGCETTCRFSCISTDPVRDCTPKDECAGPSACQDATHRCSPPVPMADGEPCNGGEGYCTAGSCTAPVCGNQATEPGEQCDDGDTDDENGCRADCRFSCETAGDCDDGNACTQDVCDGALHACANEEDASQSGKPCSTRGLDGTCASGQCIPVGCGNNVVDLGEECDLGASVNGDGSGCTKACELECHSPADCDDANACNGLETCTVVTGGKACTNGTPLSAGSSCSTTPRSVCDANGVCATSVCGDLFVDVSAGEQCDDGNTDPDDGCGNGCQYTCSSGNDCSDASPCTQDLCGSASHTCSNPPDSGAQGSACVVGGVSGTCKSGVCAPAQCGDGSAGPGEECDNGTANNGPGTGCTAGCQFECDTNTDCTDSNPCNGSEICSAVAGGKTCLAGSALTPGVVCATSPRRICALGGICVLSLCGDGYVDSEAGEECDKGANGPGTGCTTSCAYECHSAGDCTDGNLCNGDESCSDLAGGKTCLTGTAMATGAVCQGSPRMLCDAAHACVMSVCGDGWLDTMAGEECDNGTANNGPGTGCTTSCQFECDTAADCTDGNLCNGDEQCGLVSGGKRCQAGTVANAGTLCNATPRRVCNGLGSCVLSVCGDGWVDAGAGELCEPPNTVSCDAACKSITPVVCGDGVVGGAEQCDNAVGSLDGCDTSCKYELFLRANPITVVRGGAPSWCHTTTNRFGSALSGEAADRLNSELQAAINAARLNLLVQALGLDDPTGTADTSLQLGVTSGSTDPSRGAWPSTEPMDWWFLLYGDTLDAAKLPTSRLSPLALSGHAFTGSTSSAVTLKHMFGTTAVLLEMLNPRTSGRFDTATSVPAAPPPKLATGLTFLETITANGSAEGLCGNITVEALSRIPVPSGFTGGDRACRDATLICTNTRKYTYCGDGQPVGAGCNSLLDLLVGGCKASLLCDNVVTAVQPDVNNGGAALSLGTNNKVPAAQTAGNKNAFSSYFRYRARRQHATGTQ